MSPRRISRWPFITCFLAASPLAVRSFDLRSAQTQAQCEADYDWASNSLGLSPCLVAADVWGSCFNGNWNVPQLPQGSSYANPNSTTANLCTCSWAAYNLISACTACQGFDSAIANWAAYEQSCSDFLTNTYFPSNVTLPARTEIPFWAGTDPRTWNDARFNAAQAKVFAQENKPDFVQGQITTGGQKSKPPIGAIVGGVVGGVVVLIIGGTIAFLFIRKRNRSQSDKGSVRPYLSRPQIHGRSVSDVSGKSILLPQNMSIVNSRRPTTIYTTGTIHTRTGSVHSLPYSGYTSPTQTLSPPLPAQVSHREDFIEPFTLRPTSPPVSMPPTPMARKTSETTLRSTVNNHEPAGPIVVQERYAPETSERVRYNPPPYSQDPSPAASPEPVDPMPQSPARSFAPGHRTRREKASVDTQQSYDSGTSHGGGESVSAIDEVIGRMGIAMSPQSVVGSTVGGQTVATGQSVNVISRPTHKPNVSNPDA